MPKYKIGDKVRANEWNYGWRIGVASLIQKHTQFESSDLEYTVLACDMTMKGRCNMNLDLLIQSETGVVYATMSRNVTPWQHTITIDGKTIELSSESFAELKRQLNA